MASSFLAFILSVCCLRRLCQLPAPTRSFSPHCNPLLHSSNRLLFSAEAIDSSLRRAEVFFEHGRGPISMCRSYRCWNLDRPLCLRRLQCLCPLC